MYRSDSSETVLGDAGVVLGSLSLSSFCVLCINAIASHPNQTQLRRESHLVLCSCQPTQSHRVFKWMFKNSFKLRSLVLFRFIFAISLVFFHRASRFHRTQFKVNWRRWSQFNEHPKKLDMQKAIGVFRVRAAARCLTRIWATNKHGEKKSIHRFIIHISFCVFALQQTFCTIFPFSYAFVFSGFFFYHFHALLSKSRISFDTLFIGTTFEATRKMEISWCKALRWECDR